MLAMQNRDGGWGAFDRDNTAEFLCHVPFADHNAMIDPSSPDLAGRVLEALASLGQPHWRSGGRSGGSISAPHARGRRQLVRPLGSELHLRHLASADRAGGGGRAARRSGDCRRCAVARWRISSHRADGANRPIVTPSPKLRGQGRETASQTAWALLGLIAAGRHDHPAVLARIASILLTQQNTDGTWDETEFTGTGFPRVFYLRYHYYRIYFPLMALARWAKASGEVAAFVMPIFSVFGTPTSDN